jgi:hypothetical protein
MELFRPEAEKLRKQLEGWLPREKRELEATFGLGGQVDQTRFLAVVQRLKSRGYAELPPVDYMTITIKDAKSDINVRRDTLKNNTRFTITGTDSIEQYCRNESLEGLDYDVILKTAIGNPSEDDLLLEDYDMKFKVRREEERDKNEAIVTEIVSTWERQKKAFRLIRRWTFEGDGCVFDLSMVRSNKRNTSGAYIFTERFSDGDQTILNEKPSYEIEVELKHKPETDTVDKAMKLLIKAVGEVLRGLQKNSVLIRKSQKEKALNGYFNLVGTKEFRGVKPRTLEMKNFVAKKIPHTPNIREGYNVTDKADGLRVLGYCDERGELFLIDKALNLYRTGLVNEKCRNSLVDGEWITTIKNKDNPDLLRGTHQLWLFDIYIGANKKVVDNLPFYTSLKDAPTRFKELTAWHADWIKDGPTPTVAGVTTANGLLVLVKKFEFAEMDKKQIFQKAALILKRNTEYNTDGLIFTANDKPLPAADSNFKEQFKWKPAEDNTIDFLVRIEKDAQTGEDLIRTGVHPVSDNEIMYKTLILKVGSTLNPSCANPRDTILYERGIPKGGCRSEKFVPSSSRKYTAVAFNPSDYSDPLASICRIPIETDLSTQTQYIMTERSKEPIRDKCIVEMGYDMKRPDGWRWVPVRVRVDKTEKLERGELGGTLNADFTADSVWNSIHNPITKGMISTGNEAPLKGELEEDGEDKLVDLSKPYFERKANKEQLKSVEGLRNFHKHYIKGDMLLKPTLREGGKQVLDLAVGEAADINRWITNKVSFVYGMDIAAKGILDSHRGAYTKYLNRLSENAALPEAEQPEIPPMIFGIGDVSKSLATGEAGYNEEESNILRSVFGKVAPTGPIPPFVEHQGKEKLANGADVIACMFALHYFFKDKGSFQGLLNNINQNLAVNGYFVACFFDGQKVFDLLKSKKEGESTTGMDRGSAIWRITKQYTRSTLPSDDEGFGLAIQNKFISIGAEHREYLVPYELLEAKMKEIGCLPLTATDLATLGLPASTETFDVSYKRAIAEAKAERKELYPMNKTIQDYSFLNRWCIFKRYSGTMMNDEEEEAVRSVNVKEVVIATANAASNAGPSAATAAKRPATLAWQDVPKAGNAGVSAAVDEVREQAEMMGSLKAVGAISELTVSKKGMKQGLATAIAGVTAAVEPPQQEYEQDRLFVFSAEAEDVTSLKDDKGTVIFPDAARYLAPYYPFEIIDNEDPKNPVTYPSILHFMGAMEYKKATNKPGYAETIFSRDTGSIHRNFVLEGRVGKSLQDRLLQEVKDIAKESPTVQAKRYKLTYDDVLWSTVREKYLKLAYQARYEKDAKFRQILEQLREMDKVLLYRPTAKLTTDLGGIFVKVVMKNRKDKKKLVKIEGENKLGKLLMTMAGFQGYRKVDPGLVEEED